MMKHVSGRKHVSRKISRKGLGGEGKRLRRKHKRLSRRQRKLERVLRRLRRRLKLIKEQAEEAGVDFDHGAPDFICNDYGKKECTDV